MKVLVTGGAGFIGSHVVDALAAAGMSPRIFDLRPSPHHDPQEVDCVLGDLLSLDDVRAAMEGCEAVVHLAAAADVDDVARQPVAAEAVNATGTINVLEAARQAGLKRVVYASTIWVYGSANGNVDEDAAVALPDHLYTATKLAGEMYCRSYAALYGLPCTVLRFGIPYGPRARPAGVIPIFVRKALAGEPLTIAGQGLQSRRFVYVEDLAEGVVLGLAPQAVGRVYNLVGHQSVTVRGIADTVRELIGDVDVVHTPARDADFRGAEVSGARAAAELGWRPETSFADGVRHYIRWHEEQETASAPANVAPPPFRLSARLPALVLSWLVVAAVVGSLGAYLAAVHAVGLSGDDERTVGLLSVGAMAAYLALGRHTGVRLGWLAISVAWLVAVCALLAVVMPDLRETARLGTPDVALALLSLAGSALSLTLAGAAQGLRRGPERRQTLAA
jgi:UDP-glucose 4-epimerase